MAEDNKYVEEIVKRILIGTGNKGKFREIERILKSIGIEAIPPEEEVKVEEKGDTFLENAYIKAEAYYERFKMPVLTDDSGLVVYSLDGYPGVFSSRFWEIDYGGYEEPLPDKDTANIRKLLRLLRDKEDKRARFEAVIVLLLDRDMGIFSRGVCEGYIGECPKGNKGFGYDPVFIPSGMERTMAELDPEEKNRISHRGKALQKIVDFLKNIPI